MNGSFWMMLPTTDPDVLKRMREWVATQLRSWPLPRVLDATIVIDELATNAFLHGQPPYTARVILEGERALLLEVHDGGLYTGWPWELGAGLRLVTSIAPDWGTRRRRFGTVVWARVPLERDQDGACAGMSGLTVGEQLAVDEPVSRIGDGSAHVEEVLCIVQRSAEVLMPEAGDMGADMSATLV